MMISISWIIRILGKPSNVTLPQIDVPTMYSLINSQNFKHWIHLKLPEFQAENLFQTKDRMRKHDPSPSSVSYNP